MEAAFIKRRPFFGSTLLSLAASQGKICYSFRFSLGYKTFLPPQNTQHCVLFHS